MARDLGLLEVSNVFINFLKNWLIPNWSCPHYMGAARLRATGNQCSGTHTCGVMGGGDW
jgi:hypothetical protein